MSWQSVSWRVQEPDGSAPAESKMRNLPPTELLAQLPPLQKLLERLMDCLPRGVAARHFVVQASLLTIAKESFQVRSLRDGCPLLSTDCCDAQDTCSLASTAQHSAAKTRRAVLH